MSQSSSGAGASGSSPGDFVPPSVEELDAVLDAYEFIEILGKGGMGAVYKARQLTLDRLVAIKILPRIDADDDLRFAERFQREAQAMGRLSHPNIIGVYDFGRTLDGQLYIVMEYVEGTDLHQLIRTGQLTTDHLFGWFPQICDALQYAHSMGIVHRDIKPANIMINREGTVKVADFGLAKLSGAADAQQTRLTLTNVAMGTPDYVAPEVLENDLEPDHRADLYAIGVMLYEILTGKIPRGAWRPPSLVKPEIDPRFDALINRAMDADRESRFQSATEISHQLSSIHRNPSSAPVTTSSGKKLGSSSGNVKASGSLAPSSGSVDPRSTSFRAKQEKSNTGLIVGISTAAALVIGGIGAFFLFGGAGSQLDDTEELASLIATTDRSTAELLPIPEADPPAPPEPTPAEPLVANPPPETPAPPADSDKTTPSPTPTPEPSPTEPEPAAPAMAVATPPPSEPVTAPPPESEPQPAAVPEDPRIAQLEQGFQAAFERDANGAFLASVDQLDRSYLGAIERARRSAQQGGNLDEVTAFDQETRRMTAGPGIPPADNPGTPGSLVQLRQTYREALAKLEIERDEKTAPLYDKYLGALTAYEAELTKANEIPKALAVREFRGTIETRQAALRTSALANANEPAPGPDMAAGSAPAPATSSTGIPQVEVITSSAYRELATWILSEGGQIRIRHDGQEIDFRPDAAADLPNGSFEVIEVRLDQPKSNNLTDDDFTRFAGAPNLRSLNLQNSPLTKLPALAIMDQLESVQIGNCPNLTDQFFLDLGKLPALKSLAFAWDQEKRPSISEAAFEGLAASRSIDTLKLENYPYADRRMTLLGNLSTLKRLEFKQIGDSDGSFFKAFGQHPSLEAINMAFFNEQFDGSHLAALAGSPNFRHFVANVWELGPEGFRELGKVSQLETLHIVAKPSVDDQTLAELSGLGNLKRLEIGRLTAGGTGFRSFTCGDSLRSLRLESSLIDPEGLAAICQALPKLTDLNLDSQRLRAEELSPLARLGALQSLNLTIPEYNDTSLAAAGSLANLKSLTLRGKPESVTAEGLLALAKAKYLEKLDFRLSAIPENGWAALGTLEQLVELSTSPAPVTPGVADLAGARKLEFLRIGPGLADNPDEIIDALKKIRSLRRLHVNSAPFGDNPELQQRLREALPEVDVQAVR